MSATLSGPIVLENPQPISGSSRTIEFDGQMWLSTGNIITGKFRYFNSNDLIFHDVNHYIAWIHVRIQCFTLFFTLSNSFQVARVVNSTNDHQDNGSTHDHDNSVEQGSGSETLGSSEMLGDDLHLYGDIVQVFLAFSHMPFSADNVFKKSSSHVLPTSYGHRTSPYQGPLSTKPKTLLI